MTELVRGQVSDRPWGLTLGQFGVREVTGQLTVRAADGRDYGIAFDHGAIVGARSPQPADSATRIALTEGLVTSSQTASLAERIAATPDQDEVHTIATTCRLDVAQVLRLRRRLLVQRAARTFSIEQGSFVVDDVLTLPVTSDAAIDVREVIYHGARTNLTEHRLVTELLGFGSHFALASSANDLAERFGFDVADRIVLDSLRVATTLAEIAANHRELAPRTVQAMIYALVSCRECAASSPPRSARTTTAPAKPRAPTTPPAASTSTPAPAMKRAPTTPPVPWRAVTTPIALPGADDDYELALRSTLPPSASAGFVGPPTPPPRLASSSVPPSNRPPAASRTPSHTGSPAAQTVTPPRMIYSDEVGVARTSTGEPRVSSATTVPGTVPGSRAPTVPPANASTVPSSVTRVPPPASTRAEPVSTTRPQLTIPSASPAPETVHAEDPTEAAARACREGQAALSGDDVERAIEWFTKATILNPRDFGYGAALAWAQFLVATKDERVKSADKVRKLLGHAIQKSVESSSLRLYLGWLERMLGRPREALQQFSSIQEREPGHAEAQQAIAELGQGATPPKKSGLAVLFRKKP